MGDNGDIMALNKTAVGGGTVCFLFEQWDGLKSVINTFNLLYYIFSGFYELMGRVVYLRLGDDWLKPHSMVP